MVTEGPVERPAGSCVICRRRDYVDAQVCNFDRDALAETLDEIRDMWASLDDAVLPVAAGPAERVGGGAVVSPSPVNLDALDLAGPARPWSLVLRDRAEQGLDDCQVGSLSVSTILAMWCADWSRTLQLPAPANVGSWTFSWLYGHLEEACDRHPGIDRFAVQARDLESTLRGVLLEPRVEAVRPFVGEACGRCGCRTLFHAKDYVECASCGRLYTGAEFDELMARRSA